MGRLPRVYLSVARALMNRAYAQLIDLFVRPADSGNCSSKSTLMMPQSLVPFGRLATRLSTSSQITFNSSGSHGESVVELLW